MMPELLTRTSSPCLNAARDGAEPPGAPEDASGGLGLRRAVERPFEATLPRDSRVDRSEGSA